MSPEMILLIILIAVVIALGVLVFVRTGKRDEGKDKLIEEIKVLATNQAELKERTAVLMSAVNGITARDEQRQSQLRLEISKTVSELGGTLSNMLRQSADGTANQLAQFEKRLQGFEQGNNNALSEIRATVSRQLLEIKDDNGKRLEQIRKTVDEQLQTTLEEKMNRSFKAVSEQLEQVYKGLGEMQSLASGVGDLKKVLSNVKTRGILGEVQLGAILSEILNSEQYDTEINTNPDSKDRVEFAIKLPGNGDGTVYLPVDSKFPGDTYAALQDAYDTGDKARVEIAFRNLEARIKQCAKDIRDKYIKPPYTTNFAIMFLPFEGLYAEVVNHGLVEILQREYNVNVAGPSTMAALLNSLQMGFRTLAIEKRSNEVWQVLGAVKSEFETFEKVLNATQKHMKQVEDDLEKLVGTRTRAITKKLRSVEALPTDTDTASLIELN
ncbi:MAG: DNA recombination protein RmuC [Ruminiclostridium sp.]|nr:DNA recombination protein RmuC [Ruminiclostridium sp.]